MRKRKHWMLITGITTGILYGLFTRVVFGERAALASLTFLFIIPAILGMVPLLFADHQNLRSYRNIIFIPWLTVASFFLTMVLVGLEEFLCLLILAVPFFIIGTIGSLIYIVVTRNREKRKKKLMSLVLLPFLLIPVEEYIKSPSDIYTIKSEVIVSAVAETVWGNIVEVKPIDMQEYHAGFFNSVGIPRPISASVNRKETGATRTGNFEGGLQFIETITEYLPNKKVTFDIRIVPGTVRQKVFDQHVLNGNYFSFVDATYELTEAGNGKIKLSLSSSYRLNSKVNFYGRFWGDLILEDFQDRLLDVIRARCEKQQGQNMHNR